MAPPAAPGGDFGALPGAALERVARAAGSGPAGRMLGVCRHWAREVGGAGALWEDFRAAEGWGPPPTAAGAGGGAQAGEEAGLPAFARGAGVRRRWRRGAGALGAVAAHDRWAVACAVHGDQVVTGGYDRVVKVWAKNTLRWTAVLQGHSGKVSCVAAGPAGAVVSAGRGYIAHTGVPELLLWDVPTGQARALLGVRQNSNIASAIHDVAFAGEHAVLCGHGGGDAVLWDLRTPDSCAQVYRGHGGPVFGVAVAPEGRGGAGLPGAPAVGTASSDHSAGLWDARTLRRVHSLPHDDGVLAVDLGGGGATSPPGGLVVTGGLDNAATVWSAGSGEVVGRVAHRDWVRKLKFQGEFMASCGKDGSVGVWDLTDPASPQQTLLCGLGSDARCLAADWDGLWAGCTDGQLHCVSFADAPAFPHERPWGL